jgi:pimeloyl-ACP methyl ester carboxylesterase
MSAQLPVVLLPGVMGSRLYFPNSRRFWDPDRPDRMAWWAPVWPFRSDDDNRQELHVREQAGVVLDTAHVSADESARGWSTVIWSFYGKMLRRLEDWAGAQTVFAIGYDWRQDIRWLGQYTAGKLAQVLAQTGAEKVAIVTHSMGGLVARAALRVNPALVDRIAAVVHVCQPSAGAVILYRRLFTGLIRGLDGGGGLADRMFRLLLGNNQASFLANMSGLPGPMQLLPSQYFPAVGPGREWNSFIGSSGLARGALYGSANSPPGLAPATIGLSTAVLNDLRARVAELDAFHAFLGPPAAGGSPAAWLIYGTGRPTEMEIHFAGTATPVVERRGDEVVPDVSATSLDLPADQMIAVDGLAHAEACQQGQVQDHVLDILSRYMTGPSFAPPRAATSFPPPAAVGADGPDVEAWFRAAPTVAARLGARVRITVDFEPPAL